MGVNGFRIGTLPASGVVAVVAVVSFSGSAIHAAPPTAEPAAPGRAALRPSLGQLLEAMLKEAGVVSRREIDGMGRWNRVLESKGLEVRWIYGWGGKLEEMTARARRGNRPLIAREVLYPERKRETFDPPDRIRRRTSWRYLPGKPGWLWVETEDYDPRNPAAEPRYMAEMLDLKRGVYTGEFSACVRQHFQPVPVETTKDLFRITAQVFEPGDAAPDAVRVTSVGCDSLPEAAKDHIKNGIKFGLKCLLDDSKAGGSENSRARAQMLLGMMASRDMPFTIRCHTGPIPGYEQYMGQASVCGNDSAAYGTTLAPFPGITLNGAAAAGADGASLAFHEMMHTPGYIHGQFPEVCRACEQCCFNKTMDAALMANACELCKVGDSPAGNTAEYRGKLVSILLPPKGSWDDVGTVLRLTLTASGNLGQNIKATLAAIREYACGGATDMAECTSNFAALALYGALGTMASHLRSNGQLEAADWTYNDVVETAHAIGRLPTPGMRAAAIIGGRALVGRELRETPPGSLARGIEQVKAGCPISGEAGTDDLGSSLASILNINNYSEGVINQARGLTLESVCN